MTRGVSPARVPRDGGLEGGVPPQDREVSAARGSWVVDSAAGARLLGVRRLTFARLAETADQFPRPLATAGWVRLWPGHAVQAWAVRADYEREDLLGHQALFDGGRRPAAVDLVQAIARQESKALRQGFVDLDHLALALAHPDCPGASREVLASFGILYNDLCGSYAPDARLPGAVRRGRDLTTEVLLTLERANWWALRLEDRIVTSEHVLLALGDRWQESQLTKYMAKRGLDPESIWVRVIALTEGCFQRPDSPSGERDVA
ncbi:MAG: hypothetical protein J2P45_02825 [Candidatus Dormibacteraeota bacterium]|nr:hypothetical protein [Candidatus Dormibacteraeota bacterium]